MMAVIFDFGDPRAAVVRQHVLQPASWSKKVRSKQVHTHIRTPEDTEEFDEWQNMLEIQYIYLYINT